MINTVNKVIQTKANDHLHEPDESPSVRAVPPHLFFICVSLQASLFLSLSYNNSPLHTSSYLSHRLPSLQFSHLTLSSHNHVSVSVTTMALVQFGCSAELSLCPSCRIKDELRRPALHTVPCSRPAQDDMLLCLSL